ncbi:asparagine synthase (glutamine-hydrolyzing) [Chondrinema litorale]|uniref:asparagine synthase (glutamine-hydrolyzing) n=1 Tax=Chondrinema litorale TaxID=2994555 RepID=UPI002542F14F|nr:asparagine synthase (glutamine-hydrolyzing) [Chondrinema litorale]UZR95781.1 asparagine synthase (glutamine-hydrolyzing) [Chondrinema litorale]
MNRSLGHRGPDASGIYFNEAQEIALGHNRLSILDLSEHANQPFYSSCGRYVMVFNGEIYNYADLKNKIQVFRREKELMNVKSKNGMTGGNLEDGNILIGEQEFKTNSDTEVLVESFAFWGMSMAQKLNGMFAFSIFDQQEKALYIFRDRMGIKPLYYYHKDGDFVFASELKGISSLFEDEPLELNNNAVSSFLHLGFIGNNETIFKDVKAFPAGHVGIYKDGDFNIMPFWKPEEKVERQTMSNEGQAKKTLRSLIEKSVEKRMISDVPLGTFLSGGTDSSLVTAVASKFVKDQTLNTFSIGFKESKFDESKYARSVAEKLKTEHHEFTLSESDALEKVVGLTSMYDQPFADSSAIPTLLISEMARKKVTVALSGDGGDELFMGYGMYNWAKRLQNPLNSFFAPVLREGMKLHPQNRMKRAAYLFEKHSNRQSHIFSQEQYLFSERELSNLLKTPYQKKDIFKQEKLNLKRELSAVEEQAFYDLRHYLKDDLLVKVDIASMYYGLEVRVPLLDHRIVEFAVNLDESLKMKKGASKYLLKEVLYDYLPKSLMDRPKWGFSIPLGNWLKNELKYLVDQFLEESLVEAAGIVNYKEVSSLLQKFEKGHDYLYNRIWVLMLLHKWLFENGRIKHQPVKA